ncbi:MAG: hypothetical protein FWG69_04915 [Oscillospiraceae bacterium]|nr:hypothetical protein [Oscillospiraceae bacterium]
MKYRFFGKDVEPACGVCELSIKTDSGTAIFCKRHGLVSETASCKKFKYDPVKRIPVPSMPLPIYDEEDFSL